MTGFEQRGSLLVPSGAAAATVLHLPDGTTIDTANLPPAIPSWLRHLDTSAGRAIPWVTSTSGEQVDPGTVDIMRVLDCLEDQTCAVCATPLGYYKAWLLTHPARATNRPAEHEPCARYHHQAWGAGPWLHVARTYKWHTAPLKGDPSRFTLNVKLPPAVTLTDLSSPAS